MGKKILSIIILMITITLLNLFTYALEKDVLYNPSIMPTEQFLATITRPEVYNETTYKKIYLVCGSSEKKLIKFEALVFDDVAGFYKPIGLVREGNAWFMDGPGVFAEQLILPKNGVNQIRIVAYDAEAKSITPGKNLQISDYFITWMDKNDKALFVNGFQRIANMLSQLFR